MKKRLLQIVPTLLRAGAEKQMSLLARGLPQKEFDVHVCAFGGGPLVKELEVAGVPVTVISSRWRLDPKGFWQLRRHVARLRPDLVHAWRFAAGAYGYAVAGTCGVKVLVVSQRGIDPSMGWLEHAVQRHVTRRCARVVANCSAVRDRCVHHGLPGEKILVIPNGVPPAEPSRTTRRELLAELGLPEKSRLIGLVGRLLRRKRIKDAIWSADLLKVIRDDVHLLVIGDGPHRARLYRFRDQVVIRDKVHFLGQRGDVLRWMPHFDVFWSTSAHEGQSNPIMEAMAAGVPVVATDIPGTRELVLHERTGYLVPVGDRAAVARYTRKLLDDAELARRLGEAGRERIEGEFRVEKMVQRYAELYRELFE